MFFKWITAWNNKRCRDIDKKVLWPSICEQATTETKAREAFLSHCLNDDAWNELRVSAIMKEIEELEYVKS